MKKAHNYTRKDTLPRHGVDIHVTQASQRYDILYKKCYFSYR